MNLLLFIAFSFGLFMWSKNFFNVFLLKKTNVNIRLTEQEIKRKIKKDSFYFGVGLYFLMTLFNKTDSFILPFLFLFSLFIVIYIELFDKK